MTSSTLVESLIVEAAARDASDGSGAAGEDWLLTSLAHEAAPEELAGLGAAEGEAVARGLGARILARLEIELHRRICGRTESGVEIRSAVLSPDVATATITAALTAGLSVGPQAAAIAAALIVRRFVSPTMEEVCAYWDESLAKR